MPHTTELRRLARLVADYQKECGWSDAQTQREIPQIGSTKTYKRILDDQDPLDELNVANQVANYKRACDYIELRRKDDKVAEQEFDDFANITDSMAAVSRALVEDSIARFVAIQGENGCGKDAVKNALLRRWGNITLAIEANDFWSNSLVGFMGALLTEYNRARSADLKPKPYPMATFEMLVDQIRDQRLVLFVNEAHHIGPRGLNILKSLINRCPRLVIVAAFIPKLLRDLAQAHYQEALQLFGNRLAERVALSSPQADEIMLLLERRGVKFDSAATEKQAATELKEEAPQFGNWRYVGQFAREARRQCKGQPMTLPLFVTARKAARDRRVTSQQARS